MSFDRKVYMKQYRLENKEKIRQRDKQYHLENREKLKQRDKRYRLENKEKIRQRDKQYQLENKEKIKQYKKQYHLENREKLKQYNKQYKRLRLTDPKMFLSISYFQITERVKGKTPRFRLYYKGLPKMPRDEFISWSLAQPEFHKCYKSWQANNYELRFTPVPDRVNSDDGYLPHNIEWVPFHENSRRAAQLTNSRYHS